MRAQLARTETWTMSLIKSKKRVADHGEVFTPPWLVEAMLDLVKGETERIDSRFLEPACGSGNFLVQILRRKLAAVELKYGKSDFERRHYALLALMCIYGIELLTDKTFELTIRLADFGDHWYALNNFPTTQESIRTGKARVPSKSKRGPPQR